jgi:glucosamine-6-phosphate isomerase
MEIQLFQNHEESSAYVASQIVNLIKQKPNACICMASGETPTLTCTLLVKQLQEEKIDCSNITFLGLDEWVGLSPENKGSCQYFFKTKIISLLQLQPNQYFLFDALSNNLDEECKKMDAIITEKGIDIMLVGIGMNGHIGFNEPNTDFTIASHVINLDEVTKTVGQKYFETTVELNKGITIGLKHLQNAKQVFLMANGLKKATVIQQTIEGEVTPNFPASIMQLHKNGVVVIDAEAATLLKK